MRVVFRVDASELIGHGHVIRCLTLAEALQKRNAEVEFICRSLPGNLLSYVKNRGYKAYSLPKLTHQISSSLSRSDEYGENWLGASIDQDRVETAAVLGQLPETDLLIVDHYSLNAKWEAPLRQYCRRLVVIDDLANRLHDADLLIDQNLNRSSADYNSLVPGDAKVLTGTAYVLMAEQFRAAREKSLARRRSLQRANRIQVFLGGAISNDANRLILEALQCAHLRPHLKLEVLLGIGSCVDERLARSAEALPCSVQLLAGVDDMAKRMMKADLAVGACGTIAWERCCLGLPAIMVIVSRNQASNAHALEAQGAGFVAGTVDEIRHDPRRLSLTVTRLMKERTLLQDMSRKAASVVDGFGVDRVCDTLFEL